MTEFETLIDRFIRGGQKRFQILPDEETGGVWIETCVHELSEGHVIHFKELGVHPTAVGSMRVTWAFAGRAG